jgi:hypothetical protein
MKDEMRYIAGQLIWAIINPRSKWLDRGLAIFTIVGTCTFIVVLLMMAVKILRS